jgi:predicted O-methyltransferase YrrM
MISTNLLRFIPKAARLGALRRRAVARTRHAVPGRLLAHFEDLVYHPGTSGNVDTHYQDRDIGGAICCTDSEAMLLHHIARLSRPIHALEIGSYIGWSSAHLASALEGGTLTCVEPFVETEGNAGEAAHARFRANLARASLDSRIVLERSASPGALAALSTGRRWDLALVDGWHLDGQPLKDVAGVLPFLADRGVLLLHDLWIADVRDAFLHLVSRGWSFEMFDTANYLTLLWRGAEPAWLADLRRLALQPEFVLPAARGRRFLFGLGEASIETARRAAAR